MIISTRRDSFLGCAAPVVMRLDDCVPMCTRWTQINEGRPVTIYEDTSGWDSMFYANANLPNPTPYLEQAISVWNSAYSCGTLFELVDSEVGANVVLQYEPEDPDNTCAVVGSALCVCDEEDDVCVRQFDHSQVFMPNGSQARIWMYLVECIRNNFQTNQWINVYLHELGHCLGMGHVYGLPIESVMGSRSDFSLVLRLFQHDLEQLDLRYPCGCNLIENSTLFQRPPFVYNRAACPGCLVSAYF